MNILLINHYAGSVTHGMEYRPYYFGREWIRQGHSVTIVAASFSHLRSRHVHCPKPVVEEMIDGIRYIWIKTPVYAGNGVGRVWNMLTFIMRLYLHRRRVIGERNPDAVIASSTYPLDIWPAFLIARRSGAKLVHEVHDLWPLTPIQLGGMSRWHPFIVVMQMAEDFACRHADRIVSLLPLTSEYLQSRGMAAEKFFHVPNGVVVSEWEDASSELPAQHAETLARLRQSGRLIVGYAGAHGLANALYALIEAAEALQKEPVSFVLVGQGPEKEALQRRADEAGLTNMFFLPSVSKDTIPSLLSCMDLLYIGLKREPLFRFGISPNKLMDYMMAGKPVIHAIDAGNDMVQESGSGISVPPEDAGAIVDAVRRFMDISIQERARMGERGRAYVRNYHDYRVLARDFLNAVGA